MTKLYLLFFFFILSLTNIVIAKENEVTTRTNLFSKERYGIRLHRKGDYKRAYKKLYETATWGLKDSQYFLAIMYLKGQYIKQDIIIGMGLLAVANEADVKERNELFENIYASLSDKQRKQVDVKIIDYIGKFGMKVKHLKCSKSFDVGSRRPVVNCEHYMYHVGGHFEID